MRDRPADLNLPSVGETQVTPPPAGTSLGVALMTPITVLREISKTSTFWILFATFFICGLSTNGLIQTHFVTLCGDFGIVPVAAASVLAVMSANAICDCLSQPANSRRRGNPPGSGRAATMSRLRNRSAATNI